jgi:ABC-type sugar transport system ATPase subunit
VLGHSVRENFGLPNLDWLSQGGFVRTAEERAAFARLVESLRIRIPHQEQAARNLSGGNQQKVVLAKWVARHCSVLIFDEPTRGVDVGAKYEIYQLMNELTAEGKAIVMISSELPEVLGMADRILVMHEGRITGEIADARTATQEQIMELAVKEMADAEGLMD